jgi:hypothetical protein
LKKHFKEFTEEEQEKIIKLHYFYLKKVEVNMADFYKQYSSFISEKETELGLSPLALVLSKNGEIKLRNDSYCTDNLLNTIEKLLEEDIKNPETIEMLENAKSHCFLINEITGNVNYVSIKHHNNQTDIEFLPTFRSSSVITDEYIALLFKKIKSYTQNQELIKYIKILELENLYNVKKSYPFINSLFYIALREIKYDLQPFNKFIEKRIKNVLKQAEYIFNSDIVMGKIVETLMSDTDIVFDENDYSLSYR